MQSFSQSCGSSQIRGRRPSTNRRVPLLIGECVGDGRKMTKILRQISEESPKNLRRRARLREVLHPPIAIKNGRLICGARRLHRRRPAINRTIFYGRLRPIVRRNRIPPLSQISSQNAADALGSDRRMYRRLSEAGRGRIAQICHQNGLKSCKKSLTMWPLIPYRFFWRTDPRFDIFYDVVKTKLISERSPTLWPRHHDAEHVQIPCCDRFC